MNAERKYKHQVSDYPRNKNGQIKSSFDNKTGKKYGMLTVVSYWGRHDKYKASMWNCLCECGEETLVSASSLVTGNTKSCGCGEVKARGKGRRTHGLSRHPLYGIWRKMNLRCYDKNEPSYHNYGGRGISVHDHWNFENPNGCVNFIRWIEINMPRPSDERYESGKPIYTIDRKNNDGDYSPDNIKWSLAEEQNRNTRISHNYRMTLDRNSTRLYSKWSWEKRLGRICDEWIDFKGMLKDIGRDIPKGKYLCRYDIDKPFGPDNWYFSNTIQRVTK